MTQMIEKYARMAILALLLLYALPTIADEPKHAGDGDHGYPCVVAPLPMQPIGEHSQTHFEDLGMTIQAWRYPCDGDRSVPMFTFIPDAEGPAHFCTDDGVMVQGMRQSNRFHLVQDPADAQPFCGNILVPTTLAMVHRGMGGHRPDFDGEFTFMFDAQHGMDLFGYHAGDYGVDSMGHAIGRHSGLTGVWYDPDTEGQGFSIQMTPAGLVVFYFGYDADGDRLWLISSLEQPPFAYADTITLTLYRGAGGVFGQPFPDVEPWGELTLSFAACGEGEARLVGEDGETEMALIKLAGVDGLRCD